MTAGDGRKRDACVPRPISDWLTLDGGKQKTGRPHRGRIALRGLSIAPHSAQESGISNNTHFLQRIAHCCHHERPLRGPSSSAKAQQVLATGLQCDLDRPLPRSPDAAIEVGKLRWRRTKVSQQTSQGLCALYRYKRAERRAVVRGH
jgi:hypothetical protein